MVHGVFTLRNKNAFQKDAYRPIVDRIPEVAARGGCTWSGGVPVPGGCTWSGGYLVWGGCAWSRGVYLVPGGGVCAWSRGVCVPGPGGGAWSGTPPPPVNRMNDRQVYKYYLGQNFVSAGKNSSPYES